ncbi:hypothetical protein ES703_21616 [subsurface metagenome]
MKGMASQVISRGSFASPTVASKVASRTDLATLFGGLGRTSHPVVRWAKWRRTPVALWVSTSSRIPWILSGTGVLAVTPILLPVLNQWGQ